MTDHREIVRPQWPLEELPSLLGKVALVTGANSPDGVGYHVAHELALRGAKVYLGARSLEKATKAVETMLQESPEIKPESLKTFVADIGDFDSIRKATKEFLSSESRLDILVNNAALLARPLDKNDQGISVSFATNHLGPFLLTQELTPLLIKTAAQNPDVRIVNVASTSHYDAPETSRFRSLSDFNESFGSEDDPLINYHRYGYSKLATVLHTKELQRRFDEANVPILSISVHPGGVATNGAAAYLGGRDNDIFRQALTPLQGAITPLFAAAHPEPAASPEKYRGSFLMPFGGLKEPTKLALSEELGKELWSASEAILDSLKN